MIEATLLVGILCIWIISTIAAMSSCEIVSLTIAFLPHVTTLPLAIVFAMAVEEWLPGATLICISVWLIVSMLLLVRWVAAALVE